MFYLQEVSVVCRSAWFEKLLGCHWPPDGSTCTAEGHWRQGSPLSPLGWLCPEGWGFLFSHLYLCVAPSSQKLQEEHPAQCVNLEEGRRTCFSSYKLLNSVWWCVYFHQSYLGFKSERGKEDEYAVNTSTVSSQWKTQKSWMKTMQCIYTLCQYIIFHTLCWQWRAITDGFINNCHFAQFFHNQQSEHISLFFTNRGMGTTTTDRESEASGMNHRSTSGIHTD